MEKRKESLFKKIIKQIPSLICIAIGATMAAAALEVFLIPNSIIDGGLTGISIILNKLFGGSLSLFVFFLNLPFLFIGYKQLGLKFLFKAIFGIVTFSLLLEVFHGVPEVTDDIILAFIYGGLLLGVGVGIVIKFGGCLDGTEIVAILLSKKSNLSVGQVVLFINIFIYGTAIFVFGPDRALYSLLTYFITFKIIDIVSEGMDQAKAVYIITEKSEEISEKITKEGKVNDPYDITENKKEIEGYELVGEDSQEGTQCTDELITIKNRFCCLKDEEPLITILDKKVENYHLEITCKACHHIYKKGK